MASAAGVRSCFARCPALCDEAALEGATGVDGSVGLFAFEEGGGLEGAEDLGGEEGGEGGDDEVEEQDEGEDLKAREGGGVEVGLADGPGDG